MKNLIGALVGVVVCAYLPVLMLALSSPDDHVKSFLPVIPGWLVWFVAPRDEHSQYWAAAAATVCIIAGLSWFGSKGRLAFRTATFLALLNSFVCVAIYVLMASVMAAGGGAR